LCFFFFFRFKDRIGLVSIAIGFFIRRGSEENIVGREERGRKTKGK